MKSYGYVENVVAQMWTILTAAPAAIDGATLYLGDPPMSQLEWVNGFARALRGSDVRVVPRMIVQALALIGDVVTVLTRRPFLITTSRYNSMITDYVTPMETTFAVLGKPEHTLEEGIVRTVEWLQEDHGGAYKGRSD